MKCNHLVRWPWVQSNNSLAVEGLQVFGIGNNTTDIMSSRKGFLLYVNIPLVKC